jgi:tRNA(Ile2) C34 agmatinyltransferase TiaS
MVDDDSPNCPECLIRLEVAGTERNPYWWCPECKVARLT